MIIEAIRDAKVGDFDVALKKMGEGDEYFVNGHRIHAVIIQTEAQGNKQENSLLLIHAEDQLMNAETCKILAEELIDVYRALNNKQDI